MDGGLEALFNGIGNVNMRMKDTSRRVAVYVQGDGYKGALKLMICILNMSLPKQY